MDTQAEAPSTEPLSSNRTAVALTGVRRSFRARKRGEVVALDGIDLRVEVGEVVAVVGPSGCGKSTLLELVAGLQEPDAGSVEIAAACAYMPQRDLLLPWRDALGNAALALECQGVSRAEARRRAAPLFERFGLAEFERSRPAALSGGMRQRVAFLRTLLPGRPVLLLDEPFGALDSITRGAMQEWLAEALVREPRTVLLVTHDVQEALLLADRVVILSPRPGRVVAELDVALPRPRVRRELVATSSSGAWSRPRWRRWSVARSKGRVPRMARRGSAREARAARHRPAPRSSSPPGSSSPRWTRSTTSRSPPPPRPGRRCATTASLLLDNAWVTLVEVLLGLAIAVALGTLFALAMHLSRTLRDAGYPLLVGSQAIPIVVLAPIFVLVFDYGIASKLAIVALICFFPITVNVLDGLRSVDPEQLKLLRSFGAGRLKALRSVELPAALPSFFSGLRVAATVAVIGAVFGEWAGADEGLGRARCCSATTNSRPRACTRGP